MQAAERTKRKVSDEYGIPLFPHKALSSTPAGGPLSLSTEEAEEGRSAEECRNSNNPLAGLHPFNVRKAALALQYKKGQLPENRQEELSAIVRAYVHSVEPWLAPESPVLEDQEEIDQDGIEAGTITDAEIWAGLLAGMAPNSRRRFIRRWLKEGHQLPPALVAEVAAADARSTGVPVPTEQIKTSSSSINNAASAIDGLGHGWHGRAVVEAGLARGGLGELAALCARFRKSFVDALQPKHLPPGWEVNHKAPRAFGEYSVYSASIG